MRIVLVLLSLVAVVFFWQHRDKRSAAPAADAKNPTPQTSVATPRPVSEHNWAKHSLDRAQDVSDQVREKRKENEP